MFSKLFYKKIKKVDMNIWFITPRIIYLKYNYFVKRKVKHKKCENQGISLLWSFQIFQYHFMGTRKLAY